MGPRTSPVGSTEPSTSTTTRPAVRRNPALRPAAQPWSRSRGTTSTSSGQTPGSVRAASTTTCWTLRSRWWRRNASMPRTTSSGHPWTSQWTLASAAGGSLSTEGTWSGAIRRAAGGAVLIGATRGPVGEASMSNPRSRTCRRSSSAAPKSRAARRFSRSRTSRATSGGTLPSGVPPDEVEHGPVGLLGLLGVVHVAGSLQQDQLRPRDPFGQDACVGRVDHPVLGAVQDQRGDPDVGQPVVRIEPLHGLPLTAPPQRLLGVLASHPEVLG